MSPSEASTRAGFSRFTDCGMRNSADNYTERNRADFTPKAVFPATDLFSETVSLTSLPRKVSKYFKCLHCCGFRLIFVKEKSFGRRYRRGAFWQKSRILRRLQGRQEETEL